MLLDIALVTFSMQPYMYSNRYLLRSVSNWCPKDNDCKIMIIKAFVIITECYCLRLWRNTFTFKSLLEKSCLWLTIKIGMVWLHVSVRVKIIRMTVLTIWRIYDVIKRLQFPHFSFAYTRNGKYFARLFKCIE